MCCECFRWNAYEAIIKNGRPRRASVQIDLMTREARRGTDTGLSAAESGYAIDWIREFEIITFSLAWNFYFYVGNSRSMDSIFDECAEASGAWFLFLVYSSAINVTLCKGVTRKAAEREKFLCLQSPQKQGRGGLCPKLVPKSNWAHKRFLIFWQNMCLLGTFRYSKLCNSARISLFLLGFLTHRIVAHSVSKIWSHPHQRWREVSFHSNMTEMCFKHAIRGTGCS